MLPIGKPIDLDNIMGMLRKGRAVVVAKVFENDSSWFEVCSKEVTTLKGITQALASAGKKYSETQIFVIGNYGKTEKRKPETEKI